MRKVTAICIYRDNRVYNLTVHSKYSITTLIQHHPEDTTLTPRHHDTFEEMYTYVLEVLKSNNMYCGKHTDFERDFYDIAFINLDNPTEVNSYSVGGVK